MMKDTQVFMPRLHVCQFFKVNTKICDVDESSYKTVWEMDGPSVAKYVADVGKSIGAMLGDRATVGLSPQEKKQYHAADFLRSYRVTSSGEVEATFERLRKKLFEDSAFCRGMFF